MRFKNFASFWGYLGFIYFSAKNIGGLSWGLSEINPGIDGKN